MTKLDIFWWINSKIMIIFQKKSLGVLFIKTKVKFNLEHKLTLFMRNTHLAVLDIMLKINKIIIIVKQWIIVISYLTFQSFFFFLKKKNLTLIKRNGITWWMKPLGKYNRSPGFSSYSYIGMPISSWVKLPNNLKNITIFNLGYLFLFKILFQSSYLDFHLAKNIIKHIFSDFFFILVFFDFG